MAPRTSLELVEWELPALGMNSDVSAVQIPPGQAALIDNYITGEPGQMRLRQGMKTAAWINRSNHTATGGRGKGGDPLGQHYYGTSTTDFNSDQLICTGVAVYGDGALITFTEYSSIGFRGDWLYGYPSNYPGSTQSVAMRTYIMRAPLGAISTTLIEPVGDGTATVENQIWQNSMNVDGGGFYPAGPPFPCVLGRGVPFDERVAFVTPTTYGEQAFKCIQTWAGAGVVAPPVAATDFATTNGYVHSSNIKVNNGERTLDLSSADGGLTSNLKYGWLCLPKVGVTGGSNGTSASVKEAYYAYKIDSQGLEFTQEYGRGAVVSVVPNETDTDRNFHCWPIMPVLNGPRGANCVNEFQGRLFAFAGSRAPGVFDGGTYAGQGLNIAVLPNIVQWSTGIIDDWPEENYFFIDDASNDVIMAAHTINDLQLIGTKTNMYVMSGYDEESFQLDILSRHDGCVDNRSMKNIEGRIYWLGGEGLWSWSGTGLPVRESHPRSAVGIRSDIFQQREKTNNVRYGHQSSIGNVRDRVVWVEAAVVPSGQIGAPYTYHPASGSFARWHMDAYYHYIVSPSTTQRQQSPQFFFDFQNRNFVVGSNTVWEITNMFDEVSPSAGDVAPTTHTTTDAYRTTADGAGTADIGGRIQFRDFLAKPGRTVRIKNFAVEHAIQHDGTNNAFDFTFGVDHSQQTQSSILKTVTARDYDGAGTVEYDNGRYFIDRISIDGASISPEAQVFRVRFDKPATSGYRNDGGHKIYRVYAMLETTRNLRVDSTG